MPSDKTVAYNDENDNASSVIIPLRHESQTIEPTNFMPTDIYRSDILMRKVQRHSHIADGKKKLTGSGTRYTPAYLEKRSYKYQ